MKTLSFITFKKNQRRIALRMTTRFQTEYDWLNGTEITQMMNFRLFSQPTKHIISYNIFSEYLTNAILKKPPKIDFFQG